MRGSRPRMTADNLRENGRTRRRTYGAGCLTSWSPAGSSPATDAQTATGRTDWRGSGPRDGAWPPPVVAWICGRHAGPGLTERRSPRSVDPRRSARRPAPRGPVPPGRPAQRRGRRLSVPSGPVPLPAPPHRAQSSLRGRLSGPPSSRQAREPAGLPVVPGQARDPGPPVVPGRRAVRKRQLRPPYSSSSRR
jgi:hypothetical protein